MDTKKTESSSNYDNYGYKATIIQVVICIIANSALLSSGMTLGFTAVALPYMLQPNDNFHVNADQASWIASLAAISTPLGCLLSGPLIDKLGRRFGLIILNIPAFIGWMLITIRPTLVQLYIGRLLTGFALGLSSIPATIYISEGATPNLRGLLATGTSIGISMGVAIVYLMGLFLQENWQLVAGLCGIFPVISIIIIFWLIPESPVWLVTKGKLDSAIASIMTLRGADNQVEVQFELDAITERARQTRNQSTSLWSTIKYFRRPEAYKPLFLMNMFFLFQQISGIFVVIFYAVDVVKEAGVSTDPFVVAVLIGLTRLIITVLAAWMSKKFGRRPCALISGIGMTISLMILATHLYNQAPAHYDHTFEHPLNETSLNGIEHPPNETSLNENFTVGNETESSTNNENPSFLPLISLMTYILTSTIGFLTLPWTMIGEVYPSKIRGMAGGLTTCLTYLVSFIVVKIYPTMLEVLDKHGVFYFYGATALLGTVFVAVFLPETQGKTLQEIEEYFTGKKKKTQRKEEAEALHSSQKIIIQPSKK